MSARSFKLIPLDGADAGLSPLVGGKASKLRFLKLNGFRVPDGIVVGVDCFRSFLEVHGLLAEIDKMLAEWRNVTHGDRPRVSERIRELIESRPMPQELADALASAVECLGADARFAVRSSGVAEDGSERSWAGQFDSYLDVSATDVASSVRKCWASAFSARAMDYHPESYRSTTDVRFAVIVQLMVRADVAGVAFSRHPTSGDVSKVYIEAVPGYGDELVSGATTPFAATLSKGDHVLLKRNVISESYERLIAVPQLSEIAETVERIEAAVGVPVDVEWAIEAGTLNILQARPITGRDVAMDLVAVEDQAVLDLNDYELTFKVTGLSFLFCDMLASGFSYLEPLFIFYHGDFRQYFPNQVMEKAAREGYQWLSSAGGFAPYRAEFERFHVEAQARVAGILARDAKELTADDGRTVFESFADLMRRYSRMDIQFTNLTYHYADVDMNVAENLRQLSEFKDVARAWVNDMLIEPDSAYAAMVDKIARLCGQPNEIVEGYSVAEFLACMGGSNVDAAQVERAQERASAYAIYFRRDERKYLQGGAARDLYAEITSREKAVQESALIGQVANKPVPFVKGPVRVINIDYADVARMEHQMAEMQNGEILVAEFTAPELMPACRKAAAIVTDLGGMLSHAAIVSREFGIPCLVGTRFASKILRNGDVVEIDLEAGLVNRSSGTEPG
jgi:phosphohistidine swiveling domain-containing protein